MTAGSDQSSRSSWRDLLGRAFLWGAVVILAAIAVLHYTSFSTRLLSPTWGGYWQRHAVERILFILPIALVTFASGRTGGLVTLVASVLIMLPRAIWISSAPADALTEVAATALVGYLVIWMIAAQAREKALRQETVVHLQAVNSLASIVAGSLDLDLILNDALDKALDVTGLEAGLIFFVDQPCGELVLAAHRGVAESTARDLQRLRLGEGFCGRVAQSGQPLVIEDSAKDPRLTRLAVQREGLCGQVVVPLKSKDCIQGVLALATRDCRRFSPSDLELITAIAHQIGMAVESAQLHRRIARDLHIEQQLNQVAEQIASELDLSKVLPMVLQIAEDLVGADGGVIALVDQERGSISYPYVHNLPQDLAQIQVGQGAGLAGAVIDTGRCIVVSDYSTYPKAIPAFASAGMRSVLAIPIVSGEQTFGALVLASLDRPRRFSEREVATLTGVGRQAGIAIQNARLYENLRFYVREITNAQEHERERIARELHDETVQMLIFIARRLEVLATLPEPLPDGAAEHVESLQEVISRTLKDLRRFLRDLRPPTLDHLGLVAAVEGVVDGLAEAGIRAHLTVRGNARRLTPEEAELALFRIVQEALNNVRRHARASQVAVNVTFEPSQVRIAVEDDGIGFNLPSHTSDLAASGKLGLIGMYERAHNLGGTLTIHSELERGTTVLVDVPVQTAEEPQPEPEPRVGRL